MGISAFGVEDVRISKAKGDKEKQAAGVAGGASVAATGVAVGHVAQAANHSTQAKAQIRAVGRLKRRDEQIREAYHSGPRNKQDGDAAAKWMREGRDAAGVHMDRAQTYRAAGVKAAGKAIRSGKVAAVAAGVTGGFAGTGAYRARNNVKKSREGVAMNVSAFGVEDDRISKADSDPGKASVGRIATGALLSPYHALAAGKKGHKLRAIGNEWGGGMAGMTAGGVANALSRGRLGRGAPVVGSIAGSAGGTVRAQRKGHYKKESSD